MKIAVVIVNYRTSGLVIDCLKSLTSEICTPGCENLNLQVFVGDADSRDGSKGRISNFIRDAGIDNALCYDIGKNGGFAFGNNHILRSHILPKTDVDYVHFLNPDTFIRPGAIRRLAAFLHDHPEAGVAGSRLENPDGSLRTYAFRFPTPWREFFRGIRLSILDRAMPSAKIDVTGLTETREVEWVTGASFMVPRKVLDEVGLFDPGYFLYFEEVDFMARIRQSGYQVWHVADSHVVHLAGQSTGVRAGDPIDRLPPYWFRSRSKFFHDHYGRTGAILANVLFLAGNCLYRMRRSLFGQASEDPAYLWHDLIKYGFSRPSFREREG